MKNITSRIEWKLVLILAISGLVLAACGSEEATPTLAATATSEPVAEETTPTLAPTNPPPAMTVTDPEPTATMEPEETEVEATSTSPVPTLTPTTTPSPTPEAPPEPTFYTIEAGDSLIGIAQEFGVSIDAILYANGYASLDELFLVAGEELQIPLCEAYQVATGNTLSGISELCGVTLDELIIHNIGVLAPLGTLDAVPVGFVLLIPQEIDLTADADCAAQPDREQVIEYTPNAGEGIFCLSQKFSLSTTTIIQANTQRLTGDNVFGIQPLLIPPSNGAVYTVSESDVENEVTLEDIAEWYDVTTDLIVDWNGNPVTELDVGSQLFIPGANLAFGPYQFIPTEVEPTATVEGGEATVTPTPES